MKLSELMCHTLKVVWSGTKGGQTAIGNAGRVLEILGGDTEVADLDYDSIVTLVRRLEEKGNGGGTINRKLSALSVMLKEAVKLQVISGLPPFTWQKEAAHRDRVLTHAELTRIENWFSRQPTNTAWMEHLTIFLVNTGMRLSEALNLDRRQVDDARGNNVVVLHPSQTKSGKGRAVPLNKAAQQALQRGWWSGYNKDDVGRRWRAMRAMLAMGDDVVVHSLRHTFASNLVSRGVDLYVVRDLLGHSTIKMTERYAHLDKSRLAAAVEVL